MKYCIMDRASFQMSSLKGENVVNELQIFSNPEFGQIRMMEIDGVPHAVGVDVTKTLEYAYPSKAVIDHCKGITKLVIPSAGGNQETNMIPIGDVCRLIVKAADQSRNPKIKEKAERYEKWIFDEVLPAIHKHGMYATDTVIEQVLQNPDFGIKLLVELKEERDKRKELELQNAQKEQIIHELRPKATYYDLILQSKTVLSISKIAKDYGMTANEMNKLLHNLGVQYKEGGVWLLYKKYAPCGYTQSKTHVIDDAKSVFHTYWTQKGRLFIYDLLKNERGILPLIEREKEGVA